MIKLFFSSNGYFNFLWALAYLKVFIRSDRIEGSMSSLEVVIKYYW